MKNVLLQYLSSAKPSCSALILLFLAALSCARAAELQEPQTRTFRFNYAADVTGLQPKQSVRLWIPVAQSNIAQSVTLENTDLPPEAQLTTEKKYGNKLLYQAATARADGTVSVVLNYVVIRRSTAGEPAGATDAIADQQFLQADALVPVGGKPVTLLAGKTIPADQTDLAHLLYDTVDDHMQYRKDKPGWGRGDAEWACDSRFGNCTDFHSLFISLARGQSIPAKFEMGFAIPPKRGSGPVAGYHCWAWFKPQAKGWTPVDISEANQDPSRRTYLFGHLDADRVAFTVGRDLVLEPKQDGPPVNFLIYPYVEVDGKPYPPEKIMHHFAYEDIFH